jgi:hypothetical protein
MSGLWTTKHIKELKHQTVYSYHESRPSYSHIVPRSDFFTMSVVVASSKSFDATKQAALIAAVIADCEETLATTQAFHAADYDDNCHCKENLEHVISWINNAPAEDKFRRARAPAPN